MAELSRMAIWTTTSGVYTPDCRMLSGSDWRIMSDIKKAEDSGQAWRIF